MPNPTITPKQNRVRRYIIATLFKECKDIPLPLREVEIAKKFDTTRITVQRACQDLIHEGSLIRIPGRRGLFINPEYLQIRGDRKFIGIITSSPAEPIIDMDSFCALSAFNEMMANEVGDYQLIRLNATAPEEMAAELLSYPLSAAIWLIPRGNSIAAFEQVVARDFPAVAIMPSYDVGPAPACNTILPDFELVGRQRGKLVLQTTARHHGYCAVSREASFPAFRRYLATHGCTFNEEYFVPCEGDFVSKLARLIQNGKIDSLVADGVIFPHINELCKAIPKLHAIKLFLDYNRRSQLIKKEHPELDIEFMQYQIRASFTLAGRLAAEKVCAILNEGAKVQFENVQAKDNQ